MSSTLPQRIGRFRILARLGQGAMGVVYRAEQEGLGREVALKVLNPALAAQPGFHERFEREARAAAAIVHPNVITCFDTGTDGDYCYMALELAAGGDLDERCRDGALSESQVLLWMRDAAAGLAAIAEAGLLHRDLKPANIFLDHRGRAKLADLGLARLANGGDGLTQAGAIMGSPAYMSPEQARASEDIDIRSDVYALGASMFRLLTGRVPFQASTPLATLRQVLDEPLPDPAGINEDLSAEAVAIIVHAMAKGADDRYQSPEELLEDLECALQGLHLHHAVDQRSSQLRLLAAPAQVPVREATERVQRGGTTTVATAGQAEPVQRSDHHQEQVAPPAPAAAVASPSAPAPPVQLHAPEAERQRKAVAATLSREDLRKLVKRLHLAENGLAVWINLAPGACFSRPLLECLLDEAEVVHGLDEDAITAATRPSETPRRLVLAEGVPAAPGFAGRDVHGLTIPPLEVPMVLRVSPDRMQAYALVRPNALVPADIAKGMILRECIRFGIDPSAAKRLYEGPPEPSGRIVIAKGRPPRDGVPAGFHLCNESLNTTLDNLVTHDLSQVRAGDLIAVWHDAVPGRAGMDVHGNRHEPRPVVERTPEDYQGEGTCIARSADGSLELRAARSGLCQQQRNGSIRVVQAREVKGDLGPGSEPVISEDVVIVRGSVRDGARIQSSSDVVICGDLDDAEVQCSGSLQVDGVIGNGASTIMAADTVEADGVGVRRVMAGNICINGCVRSSELVATGDIQVEEIIGGSLQAGGSILVRRAGDEHGTTTEQKAIEDGVTP
ncbi:MAG: protein kinase domain-containing protein, partial [Planctomycetota bacterium]